MESTVCVIRPETSGKTYQIAIDAGKAQAVFVGVEEGKCNTDRSADKTTAKKKIKFLKFFFHLFKKCF